MSTNNFTVENLVAKYCNYVKTNCSKIREGVERQAEDGKWKEAIVYPVYSNSDATEQLLVTLYKHVAGTNADEDVLTELSDCSDNYFSDALSEEEFSFLCGNFEDVVAFTFPYLTENNGRFMYSAPTEMVDIIRENTATLKKGDTVYVADARNGDIASMFPECTIKGYTSHNDTWIDNKVWALVQIRLFAQGMISQIHKYPTDCMSETYIEDVDLVIMGTSFHSSVANAESLYRRIKPGAQMILFMNEENAALANGRTYGFRKAAVTDSSIKKIISFEYEDDVLEMTITRIALIIEKSVHSTTCIENNITGESFEVSSSILDSELLWPSFYKTTRPESGIPLSDIVSFVDLSDKVVIKDDGDWVLPEEVKGMSVAVPAKMARDYKDANLLEQDLDLAGSPLFDDKWKFWIRALNEPCVLLYGNKEKTVVGYIRELPESGIATLKRIVCLVPKNGIDVRYVAALLLTPIVKEQIESICQCDINDNTIPLVIDKVIVPNHSEKERFAFLSEANYDALYSLKDELEKNFKDKYDAMKADYINEVRMRKHDMGQYVFEMLNIEDLIRYYLDNRETENDYCQQIGSLLDKLKSSLGELDTLLKDLSKEDRFSEPEENFDIHGFLTYLSGRHANENYIVSYECNEQSIIDYWHAQGFDETKTEDADIEKRRLKEKITPPSFRMSSVDISRMAQNILNNAQKHGFTDKSRNDYMVKVSLSIDSSRNMFQIDFANNGNPLPKGIDKMRYGLRGEPAGENKGSGIGGYYIRSFVEHYDGDYDVFMKDGWVVIRIFLPIK